LKFPAQVIRVWNNRLTACKQAGAVEINSTEHSTNAKQNPFVWGKIGTTELLALEYDDRLIRTPVPGISHWKRAAQRLFVDSGVFPVERASFGRFCNIYREALRSLNGVLAWQSDPFLQNYEERLIQESCPQAARLNWHDLGYGIYEEMMNLRWLVVSPFVKTMAKQAQKFHKIHAKPHLADFAKSLGSACCFLECPQLASLQQPIDLHWEAGLARLTKSALAQNFDLALVGAGAWSLPLLSNLKKAGKSGIHLGGEMQLLFGIKGRRWDHQGFYNEHWVRPSKEETPLICKNKENGCYW